MSTDKLSAEQEAIRRYPPKYPRSTSDPDPDDDSVYDLNEEARMRFISGADWYRDTVAKRSGKWSVALWGSQEVLMYDGVISAITNKELSEELNKVGELLDRIKSLEAERDKLQQFKQYVHDRLDKMGVPADPEPDNNADHGCRIEGRLNVVEKIIGNNVA